MTGLLTVKNETNLKQYDQALVADETKCNSIGEMYFSFSNMLLQPILEDPSINLWTSMRKWLLPVHLLPYIKHGLCVLLYSSSD